MLTKLIIFIIIAFILSYLPVIGKYLGVIDTLIHELGHALMAIITFGRVNKIELFANTEGTAWTQNRFWLGRVLTSVAGYPFSSFMVFLFLFFIHQGNTNYVLITLIAMLVVTTVLWVRNFYGMIWALSFGAGFYALLHFNIDILTENVILLLVAVLFASSLKSALDILILSFKTPKESGDAINLARATWIPAPIWGIFFFIQAVFFSYQGINLFI